MIIKITLIIKGVKKTGRINIFPRDRDTLWIINKIEAYLGLESANTDKMSYAELLDYIDQLSLMLSKKK